MESVQSYLEENFEVKSKNSSKATLQKWRNAVRLVKNLKRQFRFIANIEKRNEVDAIKCKNQEKSKLRVAMLVSREAIHFMEGVTVHDYAVPEEVLTAGFEICGDKLSSIVEIHNIKALKSHGGVESIAAKLATSTATGITTNSAATLLRRQKIYGTNRFFEAPTQSFWIFVWEALQDATLMILAICAIVSLIVGIATEGSPKGAHDGIGIVASILLVVFVTATSDYRQSLQFKGLDKEKKKIAIHVTRNGSDKRSRSTIFSQVTSYISQSAIKFRRMDSSCPDSPFRSTNRVSPVNRMPSRSNTTIRFFCLEPRSRTAVARCL